MKSIPFALCLLAITGRLLAAEEVTVTIKTLAARMKYDTAEFTVSPGAKVRLILVNEDAMPHNLVVTKPATDQGFAFAQTAWALGAQGPARHWVPDDPRVIATTKSVPPQGREELVFTVPAELGNYPYVCTFPGHAMVMNGVMPFEIHEMRVKPDGFELTFTQPVEPKTAADPASYSAEAWTYIFQSAYGSPEVDKVTPRIVSATVAADGRSVRLKLDQLTKGHVHAISASGLRNAAGKVLLHPTGDYTLNEIPK